MIFAKKKQRNDARERSDTSTKTDKSTLLFGGSANTLLDRSQKYQRPRQCARAMRNCAASDSWQVKNLARRPVSRNAPNERSLAVNSATVSGDLLRNREA